MSSEYFVKATEHSIDLVYEAVDATGKVVRVETTVPRGKTYEFVGDLISQAPTPDTPMPREGGMAGGGYTAPIAASAPAPVIEEVIEETPVVVDEKKEAPVVEEAPAPAAKRGRKSNAEKAAEAAASSETPT